MTQAVQRFGRHCAQVAQQVHIQVGDHAKAAQRQRSHRAVGLLGRDGQTNLMVHISLIHSGTPRNAKSKAQLRREAIIHFIVTYP